MIDPFSLPTNEEMIQFWDRLDQATSHFGQLFRGLMYHWWEDFQKPAFVGRRRVTRAKRRARLAMLVKNPHYHTSRDRSFYGL